MPDDQVPVRTLEVRGFDATLGLRLEHYDGDEVLARLTVQPSLLQPYGIVHGGVYCSVVETTASVGAALWFGERGNVVGVSNNTSFLRAVREGELTVRATPVQRGRTQQLWSVDVRDEQDRLVATGQVRLANLASADVLGRPAS
jgi:1,4-dihydroxy-2-naphthoyl-CoA hydrolase